MLFDHCAQCQRCCHVDPGFPALEITLTKQEKKGLRSVCIEGNCEYLGDAGCNLGEAKPLSCKLYPLAYNPQSKNYYFDTDCPLMPAYQAQLADPASEASTHLNHMEQAIQALSKTDPAFLRANYKVDSYYFDLEPLQLAGNAKKGRA
jgi:Fe-S-cluster containining protein